MSDVNLERQWHEKRRRLFRALLGNVICSGIGWIILCTGYIGLTYAPGSDMKGILVGLAGMVILAAPLLIKWMATRSVGAMFDMREYEVITTTTDGYGNQTTTSDGGMQSQMTNLAASLIISGVMLVLAFIIQPIRIFIMAVKYAVYCGKTRQKPLFIKTAFFVLLIPIIVLIIGVAIFIFGILIGGSVQQNGGILNMNIVKIFHETVIKILDFIKQKQLP